MREMSVILTVSDVHLGKKTLNYSFDKFNGVFDKYEKEVVRQLSILNKYYEIRDVNLFLLGDNLDGEVIYPGHAFDLEMTVVESIRALMSRLSSFIDGLVDLGYNVSVYGVAGNHGRSNKHGKSNWEILFYEMLAEKYEKDDRVDVRYNDWYIYEEIGGVRVLGVHGEQIRMYQNIPLYGIIQKAMRWQESIGDFDILLLGHFHTTYYMDWNGILIFGSGTAMDGDDWTMKLGLKPSLKWWGLGISDGKLEWMKLFELGGD